MKQIQDEIIAQGISDERELMDLYRSNPVRYEVTSSVCQGVGGWNSDNPSITPFHSMRIKRMKIIGH